MDSPKISNPKINAKINPSVYVNTIFVWSVGLWLFLLGALASTIVHPFDRLLNRSGDFVHIVSRYFGRALLFVSRIKVTVEGLENINKNCAYLICSNHQSLFDILVLDSVIPLQFRFVVKKELFSVPVLGWCLKIEQQINVDRKNRREGIKSIQEGINRIKKGRSVLIFPEGTRSADGNIKEFKKGSMFIATMSDTPILPVTIAGTFQIMSPKKPFVYPKEVKVIIKSPFDTKGLSRMAQKSLAEKVRTMIIADFKPPN